MTYTLLYEESVVKEDIPKLTKKIKQEVKKSIQRKLTTHPEIFGKPLRKSRKGYRGLRVGNYRVIFRIQGKTVKIFGIKHRSVAYKKP
jgi:mRNA interferase RelE/StbE